MLDQGTIRIVKSTAPILQEHGETLTQHFYRRMFLHNPEVAPFFNPAHQKAGTQQRALAGAIAAYAANIDNLDVLGGAVELIAQKHASLQIKAEHYPIVGENLLASIREVLGPAATDEIIDAWAKAYGLLADILIGREAEIYDENAKIPGGWEGFKDFIVDRKENESTLITSFYLKAKDGKPLPMFLPGQYITVKFDTPNGSSTMRNYSLSNMPGDDYFRISVKREAGESASSPQGYVSNKLHDEIKVGDVIAVAPPCGEFTLDDAHDRPLVFLAGGIGITPIMSMLQAAISKTPEREIILIHACLNEAVQPFKSFLNNLARECQNLKVHFCYSELSDEAVASQENATAGLVTAELIESFLPSRDADYYFCGPKAFMVNIYEDLLKWGIPGTQVHFEFFGPKQSL